MQELPHDDLAEKSLIGCLLVDGPSYNDMADLSLVREDFHNPRYGLIFESIKELVVENQAIDYVTVCSKLTELSKLDEIGGKAFVLSIVEDQASSANIYHYAKSVKGKSSLRNIVRVSQKISEKGLNYSGKIEDFITEVEAEFFKLTNESKTAGMTKLNTCLMENLKELEDTSRVVGEISGLPTGYNTLDQLLLGLQPGQLIVLAGRPAMGKTALGMNIAINACEVTKLPVAIFSLEMLSSELSMRLLSSKAKVDSKKIRKKDFLDTDLRNIGKAVQELSNLPIFINDSGMITVFDIQSHCRKIKAEYGLGMIIVDYLQLLNPHNKNAPREQQISEMSRYLKSMAKELECPIMALSQLNRGVESRPNKRPMLSDLRESGAIEQDADIVMMVYRDEFYNPETKEPGIAEISVVKNRSGETGVSKLTFIGAYTSFENPSFSEPPHTRN